MVATKKKETFGGINCGLAVVKQRADTGRKIGLVA